MNTKKLRSTVVGIIIATGPSVETVGAVVRVHIEALFSIKPERAVNLKLGSIRKVKAQDLFQIEETA